MSATVSPSIAAPLRPAVDDAAITRIDALDAAGQSVSRGTGTYVASRLVLTALHVVANRRSETLAPYTSTIRLTFPGGFTTTGTIMPNAWNRTEDWCLLALADEPPLMPMPLAELVEPREWTSHGYPDAQSADGLTLSGSMVDLNGRLGGVHAYQLYSPQAAAGAGGKVKGLSGAPVVVEGRMVGLMRFALMGEEARTEMGTLYACPVALVEAGCPWLTVTRLAARRRTTQILAEARRWEFGAMSGVVTLMAGALVMLSLLHMPTATLDAGTHVDATNIEFELSANERVLLETTNGLLRAQSLHVTGVEGVDEPRVAGPLREAISTASARVSLAGSPSESQLALDLSPPLHATTRIWAFGDQGGATRSFSIALASASRDSSNQLRAQFTGSVSVAVDGDGGAAASPRVLRAGVVDDSLAFLPVPGGQLRVHAELLPGARILLDEPVVARDLAFDDLSVDDRRSALQRGELHIGQDIMQLLPHDEMLIGNGAAIRITQLIFPEDSGLLRARFTAVVRDLRIVRGADTINAMPRMLDVVWHRWPAPSSAVGVAAALGLLYLALRVHHRRKA
jgi:hypothetical protein